MAGGVLETESRRDGVWGRKFVGRDLRRKARARQCFCPKKAARAIYEKVASTPRVAGYLALSGQGLWRPEKFGWVGVAVTGGPCVGTTGGMKSGSGQTRRKKLEGTARGAEGIKNVQLCARETSWPMGTRRQVERGVCGDLGGDAVTARNDEAGRASGWGRRDQEADVAGWEEAA